MKRQWIRLISALLCVAAFPVAAWAHPHLRSSTPSSGSVISEPLSRIELVFSERIEHQLTQLVLISSAGDSVRVSGFHPIVGNALAAEAMVPTSLRPGKYVAAWSCVGMDGHALKGQYTFEIVESTVGKGNAVATVSGAIVPGVSPQIQVDTTSAEGKANSGGIAGAIARFVTFSGVLLMIGSVAFRFLIIPKSTFTSYLYEVIVLRSSRIGLAGAAAILCSALVRVVLQSRDIASGSAGDSMSAVTVLTGTHWGSAMQLLVASAIIAIVSLSLGRRTTIAWIVAGAAGIAAAIGVALGGHSGSVARLPRFAILADILHVLAVSCWIGSLVVLASAALPVALRVETGDRWQRVALLVRAFSRVAMISMAVIVSTGVFAAWLQLQELRNLFGTTYGKVLILKVGLFVVTAAIGAYNFRIVTPRLGTEQGARLLSRSAKVEVTVAAAILIVTGFLTGLSAT